MDNYELAEALIEAYANRDYDLMRSLFTDDFTFAGPIPEPVGPDQYIGVGMILEAAFPDLSYSPELIGVDGDIATITLELSGTHEGDLDLRPFGMDIVPPTGIAWHNAREDAEVQMADGQIVGIYVTPSEDAGMPAILRQLGLS